MTTEPALCVWSKATTPRLRNKAYSAAYYICRMYGVKWIGKPNFKQGCVIEFVGGPYKAQKGLVVQSGFRVGSTTMFIKVKRVGVRGLLETEQPHTRILHDVQWKVREPLPPHVIYSYGTGRLRCSQDS